MTVNPKSARLHAFKEELNLPSEEHLFTPNWLGAEQQQLYIKRDDLINPLVSGNKWRKLEHTLEQALENNCSHIISFGGGHSNHLHALAHVCQKLGINFTAIIRGDYQHNLTSRLQDIKAWGGQLCFVTKITYKKRHDVDYLNKLQESHPGAYIVPEGGSQNEALLGVGNIVEELTQDYDYIIAPVASGGTLAGLIKSVPLRFQSKVIGVGVLKGQGYLEQLVCELFPASQRLTHWHIEHDYHFGGYAKQNDELRTFCQYTEQEYGIPLEPVYSGKLFWAVKAMLEKQYFPPNSKILLLHTGGVLAT